MRTFFAPNFIKYLPAKITSSIFDIFELAKTSASGMFGVIKSNLNLGKGSGPINHLNSITIKKKFN